MKSWRRSRPFWGGLLMVGAGAELLFIPFAIDALPVAILFGRVGAGYLIALVMMVAGVLVWLQPGQRVFLGLVCVLLSMASFVYANLGGFLIGMTLGLLGGVLAMAWTPVGTPANRLDRATVRSVLTALGGLTAPARRHRRPVARERMCAEAGTPSREAGVGAKTREPAG
ncbi:DUF6114 domain-containing protein [Rhizohabitans arisaemae]|uniref:DUF6114 domain-containing protein n=1 Tax=Rhizohabitans arisaemae TaxID=2720610 RepID=UPI0024B0BFA8|nr:DUF6114 domain-containing protein [Rhizohabitans arisaemae]